MPIQPETARLVAAAAELRVAGSSWEKVAAKLGRTADTVRRWPRLYPDLWADATRAARRELAAETDAETIATLRNLLRSESEAMQRDAAKALLALHRTRSRSARPAADPFAGISHDDLLALADEFLDEPPGDEGPH